jgi:hypothetical protein
VDRESERDNSVEEGEDLCVIAISDKVRLSEDQVERMFDANDAGAGIAWREMGPDGIGQVKWEKGLDVKEVTALALKLPIPYIAHFRIPTCGGRRADLTHPFPVDIKVPLYLKGFTPGYVMFHNGHWMEWKKYVLDMAVKQGVEIPDGAWSDSRAMAFVIAKAGIKALEFMDEKAAVLSYDNIEIFGSGWTRVNEILVSNTHWEYRRGTTTYHGGSGYTNYTQTMCRDSHCTSKDLDNTGYCKEHTHKKTPGFGGVIDVTPLPKEDEGETEKKVTNDQGSGGSSTESPFFVWTEAEAAYKAGKLSKSKWKAARRVYEAWLDKKAREYSNSNSRMH